MQENSGKMIEYYLFRKFLTQVTVGENEGLNLLLEDQKTSI